MVGRFLALLLGLAGVIAGSQAPNYTQNYLQNLEGRIDELRRIVESIIADREAIGYDRDKVREVCAGTNEQLFQQDCVRNEEIESRYERLVSHQEKIKAAGMWMAPITLARNFDKELVENTLKEYKVAVPATGPGFAYGGGLGLIAWLLGRVVFGLLGAPFRRN